MRSMEAVPKSDILEQPQIVIKGVFIMVKTIQVRVENRLKDSADSLFESLGLDTSTAVRMFLISAIETGGIPFAVVHNSNRDTEIREAIARRKAGERFYTSNEFLANMKAAIKESVADD